MCLFQIYFYPKGKNNYSSAKVRYTHAEVHNIYKNALQVFEYLLT